MKNKRVFKTLSALCAALVLMGGFSVTAFAQGTEQPPAEDATNDENVVVEEAEDSPALTPEGNAALVDDFGGNKQLITVTTKAGNYFYILIDRASEDKETAVHFLNQVDEADLMALMEDGQSTEKPPAVCNCTEKCEAGEVNTKCEVCSTDMTGCTGKEPEPETPAEPAEPEKKESAGLNPAVLLLVLAVMGGVSYALMSRCGLEPERYFTHEDFMAIFDFNTPATIGALGTAVSQINQQVLRQIGVTIRNYEREQLAERSKHHEESHELHPERISGRRWRTNRNSSARL